MLGRLWAAVTGWFRSGPGSQPETPSLVVPADQLQGEAATRTDAVSVSAGARTELEIKPPAKLDDQEKPLPAIPVVDKLVEDQGAAKRKQLEASVSSKASKHSAELQTKARAKLDELEKPAAAVPAADKLLEDQAAAKRKQLEASVSSKASKQSAELQKKPPAKLDELEKPAVAVPAADKLLQDQAAAKRKQLEASVSSKASKQSAELQKKPPAKLDELEKPAATVPAADKLLQDQAAAKRKQLEASVSSKASKQSAELQKKAPAKLDELEKPAAAVPAADMLLEDQAAAKRKQLEASVSSKASKQSAELQKKPPAKLDELEKPAVAVPAADKLLEDKAAAKRKQLEASVSSMASGTADVSGPKSVKLLKRTHPNEAPASPTSEATSTLPRRLEELKQTLKDKQERLAFPASSEGSDRRKSEDASAVREEQTVNIFSEA